MYLTAVLSIKWFHLPAHIAMLLSGNRVSEKSTKHEEKIEAKKWPIFCKLSQDQKKYTNRMNGRPNVDKPLRVSVRDSVKSSVIAGSSG